MAQILTKNLSANLAFKVVTIGIVAVSVLTGARAQATAPQTESAVCNVKDYGARGDGKTKDTRAIQKTIDQCASGGTVLLPAGGTYLSGTVRLKSDITFRIEPGATLKGSQDDSDYPDLLPPTQNSQLNNCRKALLYGESLENVNIVGNASAGEAFNGNFSSLGAIDGSGTKPGWQGPEKTRPMAIFIVLSRHVNIDHLQVLNSGMWTLVNLENNDVTIDTVLVHSPSGPTRDGIDIVDCTQVVIQNCDIFSEDDSICLKSGSQKGVHDVVVKNSVIRNSLVANAIKLGTASTGAFENVTFENIRIEASKQAAMAVESVDGARVDGITFKNIEFHKAGVAFFVLLGLRKGAPKVGSIKNVSFENIKGDTNLNWGSAITGTKVADKTYKLENIHFSNVQVTHTNSGGVHATPQPPPEYAGQYPDPRMWNPLPAFGLYLRHVDAFVYESSQERSATGDPRQALVKDDVR